MRGVLSDLRLSDPTMFDGGMLSVGLKTFAMSPLSPFGLFGRIAYTERMDSTLPSHHSLRQPVSILIMVRLVLILRESRLW